MTHRQEVKKTQGQSLNILTKRQKKCVSIFTRKNKESEKTMLKLQPPLQRWWVPDGGYGEGQGLASVRTSDISSLLLLLSSPMNY